MPKREPVTLEELKSRLGKVEDKVKQEKYRKLLKNLGVEI